MSKSLGGYSKAVHATFDDGEWRPASSNTEKQLKFQHYNDS